MNSLLAVSALVTFSLSLLKRAICWLLWLFRITTHRGGLKNCVFGVRVLSGFSGENPSPTPLLTTDVSLMLMVNSLYVYITWWKRTEWE